MRVQCPNCKKKFNYEKAEGFCPHCATLLTAKPETPAKAAAPMRKRIRIRIPVIAWVFIGLLVVYLGTVAVANIYGWHLAKEQRVGYLEPVTFTVGETITIDHGEITITEIDWDPEPQMEIPKGEQLLRIHYITTEDYAGEVEALLCVDGQYTISQLKLGMKVGDNFISTTYTKNPQMGESNFGFMIPEDAESVQLMLTDENVPERYVLEVK